jgi:predicted dehydrogenase
MYDLPPHFWDRPRSAVGPDLIGHVDVPLGWLMGARPVEVLRATGSQERGIAKFGPGFLGYDTVEAELRYDNGVAAVVRVTWGDGEERQGFKQPNSEGLRFKFRGTKGRATYHAIVPQGHSYPNARDFRGRVETEAGVMRGATPLNYQDAIVAQTENIAAAAAANDPGLLALSLEDALAGELAIHAIHEAIETGEAVRIPALT